MKFSYIILLAILLSGFNSYAQNTFPASGSVGIGTTTPVQLLDVTGAGGSFSSTAKVNALFVQDHTNYRGLYLGFDSSGQIGVLGACTTNNPSNLAFWNYRGASGWAESMRITSDGNVGIGITGPSARLHIVGSGISTDGGNSVGISNNDLAIQANTGGRSTTLGAQLEFIIPANTDGTNAWGQARIITVAGNTANTNATGKMILGTRRMFDKLHTGSQWYYGDDIVIDGSGNIGMGTLSPDQKLSVNGTIHSKAVNIDLNGWSDYVFKKDYNLRPLSEVKTYIDQNQHLPEVPSEQELIKKGLDVSEMNKLLMKKVEELTLYMIEKDKQAQKQQAEIDELKVQMKTVLKP